MQTLRCRNTIWAGLLTAIILLVTIIPAQTQAAGDSETYPIKMEVNASQYIDVGRKIKRLAVANPKIADVSVLSGTELNIVAISKGTTTITVFLEDNNRINYLVTVLPIDSGWAKYIEEQIGLPNVHVDKFDDRVMLRGTVKNQKEMERAVMIATMYIEAAQEVTGEGEQTANVNIANLLVMENPVQINLEALVLDISSAKASNFGFLYANASSISTSDTGVEISFGTVGTFNGGQNYAHYGKPFSNVDVQIQALVDDGYARVLSRPNITTLSGEKAEILIGGSIPLPTTDSDGGVNVSWQDYGIKLGVAPKLDTENKITAKVETEVSTLDYDHAVTSSVGTFPAMTKRTASAAINLESGMTMVIGGLLNSQDGRSIKKIPLLGDIPIIGEFFKFTSKTKDKRELMILIRPRIVETDEPARMSQKMEDMYKKDKEAAESRNYVDLNESTAVEEQLTEPFEDQSQPQATQGNQGTQGGELVETGDEVEDSLVKGAKHSLGDADRVLSEGADDISTDLPESTESTTLENSSNPESEIALEALERPRKVSTILPESNESNLMDKRDSEAPTSSQSHTAVKTQSDASDEVKESESQSQEAKEKEEQAELMKKLTDKLNEVNALLQQVADQDKK